MKTLTTIFLFSGVLACCCTTAPHAIEPILQENRVIDSCEVFLRRLRANMMLIKEDGYFYYSVKGEWAKWNKEFRSFNVKVDFHNYKNCLIGLTPEQVRYLLGEPTYVDTRGERQYSYLYIRTDTSSVRTAIEHRRSSIEIYTRNDTIRYVDVWSNYIHIE